MDVERIQKINNLALDLMKQGLAEDRDDAIAQAEKIFSGKDSEVYSEMRETLEEIKQDVTLVKEVAPEQTAALSEDAIKNILQQNTDFLVKTIKEFQAKMESMQKEMSALRTKMNYKELPTVKDIVKEPIKEINLDEESKPEDSAEEEAIIENVAPEPAKKENHPELGHL